MTHSLPTTQPARAPNPDPGVALSRVSWDLVRRLLHQQLWCWGKDVKHEPNLLLEAGFERTARPGATKGTSRYRIRLANGDDVALWGFGAWYRLAGERLGAMLIRPRTGPLWAPDDFDDVFFPTHLRRAEAPSDPKTTGIVQRTLPVLCEWVADSEEDVIAAGGLAMREAAVADFDPSRRVCEAAEMPALWRRVLHE